MLFNVPSVTNFSVSLWGMILLLVSSISIAQSTMIQPKVIWLSSDVGSPKLFRQLKSTDTPIDTNNLLLDRLSQYQFDFQTVPSARIERLMADNDYVCATNRLKTPERSQRYTYSQPLNLYLGIKLYSLKNTEPMPSQLLNKNGDLKSLNSLFKHYTKRRLGVSFGRSYGNHLDAQIMKLEPSNVLKHTGVGSLQALLSMVLRERVDYVIEFPVELNNLKLESKTERLFESYTIAGTQSHFVGYVACNNNPYMLKVIAAINQQLNMLYKSEAFYRAHINYLHKSDISRFNSIYKQVFGQY